MLWFLKEKTSKKQHDSCYLDFFSVSSNTRFLLRGFQRTHPQIILHTKPSCVQQSFSMPMWYKCIRNQEKEEETFWVFWKNPSNARSVGQFQSSWASLGVQECPSSRTGCTQTSSTRGDLVRGHRASSPLAFLVCAAPLLLFPHALFESVQSVPGDAEASEGNGAMSLH